MNQSINQSINDALNGGQVHGPTTLPNVKKSPLVPFRYEAGWNPQLIQTLWRGNSLGPPSEIEPRILHRLAWNLATILKDHRIVKRLECLYFKRLHTVKSNSSSGSVTRNAIRFGRYWKHKSSAQVSGPKLLTAETRVQSAGNQRNPCRICGEQRGTRTSFSPSPLVFECHYFSIFISNPLPTMYTITSVLI
jgi:hypothetical protein